MRNPKVENKYNLKSADVGRMIVVDRSKLCEPIFWRNTVINAWCISGSVGTDADRQFGTDNEYWIGIYDKPYYRKDVRLSVTCWGGMGKYEFQEFFNMEEIENERDLETQEKVLEVLNMLLDNGILKLPEE